MSERINTPFTNEHFAAFCLAMVGQPYWYGTCVYKCTESLRSRKAKQYSSHYKDSRTAQYKKDIAAKKVCADCVGGCKGYAWTGGGIGVVESIGTDATYTSKYGANGCPDKSANGMFSYAKSKGMDWGGMDTLPDVVGIALHKDGHVGYTVGDGYAVEWKGFSSGCVKTKISGRGWTNWYKLPFIDYNVGATAIDPPTTVTLGSRQLSRGMNGADVKAMQELLIQLGYDLPKYGADGKFGTETERALIMFQQDLEIEADGKYGIETHTTMMDTVADDDDGQNDPPADESETETPDIPKPAGSTVVIVSEGGKVNVRVGNATKYARISAVAPGVTLEYIATAPNGWNAVVIGSQIGWVSGNYSKVI